MKQARRFVAFPSGGYPINKGDNHVIFHLIRIISEQGKGCN